MGGIGRVIGCGLGCRYSGAGFDAAQAMLLAPSLEGDVSTVHDWQLFFLLRRAGIAFDGGRYEVYTVDLRVPWFEELGDSTTCDRSFARTLGIRKSAPYTATQSLAFDCWFMQSAEHTLKICALFDCCPVSLPVVGRHKPEAASERLLGPFPCEGTVGRHGGRRWKKRAKLDLSSFAASISSAVCRQELSPRQAIQALDPRAAGEWEANARNSRKAFAIKGSTLFRLSWISRAPELRNADPA